MSINIIDIHSHILFGIDDGPKTIEESLFLAKQAIKLGCKGIVCSSHYKISIYENKDYFKNFYRLKKIIKEQKINLKLYSGNEILLEPNIFKYLKEINTINNTRYVLVEIPYGLIFKVAYNMLENIKRLGYIPIVAHIERYNYFKTEEIIILANNKILLQMNLNVVNSKQKRNKKLLKKGYIKLIATDSHRIKNRNYNLKKELDKLEKIIGKKELNKLIFLNPNKIINGEILKEKNNDQKVLYYIIYFKLFFKNIFKRIKIRRLTKKS